MAAMTSTMVQASDPDQLQDFCVADLSPTNPVIVNGFPCKPTANVTSKDFLFTGLSTPGNSLFDITRAFNFAITNLFI
jgi:hypothetical protein